MFAYRRALLALYDGERHELRGAVGAQLSESEVAAFALPGRDLARPLSEALAANDVRHAVLTAPAPGLESLLGACALVPLRAATTAAGSADGLLILSRASPIYDADLDRLRPLIPSPVPTAPPGGPRRRRRQGMAVLDDQRVGDPVMLTDARQQITLANLRAEALFKFQPARPAAWRKTVALNRFVLSAALCTSAYAARSTRGPREVMLLEPSTEGVLLFELRTLPATNYSQRCARHRRDPAQHHRPAARHRAGHAERPRLQSAEEEIRLERDRLNLIMRSVPNPIILLDIDNQPILMNHEALRLFQASAARTAVARERAQRVHHQRSQVHLVCRRSCGSTRRQGHECGRAAC